MREYLGASPHREAIPKLFPWCDEAATVHWQVDERSMPTWDAATGELLRGGRMLRVKYPSPDQIARRINIT